MMFLLYLGCFVLVLYYLCTKNYNYWKSRGVPFDKPFLIFGSFYDVAKGKKNITEQVRSIYSQHSTPYVGIYTFTQPALMIRSPEMLRKILVKDFDKFANRRIATNERVDPLSYHTLFSSKDATWRNIRAKISPVFTSGKMKLMFPLMQDCSKDLIMYLNKHNGKTVEFKAITRKFAVDIISSCAFGINSFCLRNDDSEIMKMATQLLDPNSLYRNFSMFSFFFIPKFVDIFRLTFADKEASDYLMNVFKQTLEERENKNIVRHDLIYLLNNLKKNESFNESYKFDDMKMASQAVVFFSAGDNTTSSTLSFALHELAINKEVQDRLREEVNRVIDKNENISYEVLQELKYLDMVVNETLRKYPLATFLNRVATANYTFEETGLTIEKDTPIFVPVAGLHFDPEYFPNPERFHPERFSYENNIKQYTFMPFGEGPRNCIGQRFALLVTKVALAYMIKNFAFEVSEKTQIPLEYNTRSLFLKSKHGIYLRVVKI